MATTMTVTMPMLTTMTPRRTPPSGASSGGEKDMTPATPYVVRREKRRRRVPPSNDVGGAMGSAGSSDGSERRRTRPRIARQGFVFDDAPTQADAGLTMKSPSGRSVSTNGSSSGIGSASGTFVFRVKKSHKPGKKSIDPASASAALVSKKERAVKSQKRRERLLRMREEQEAEKRVEAALEGRLTDDQMTLYHSVRDQVRREIRRTRAQFANSAARSDILQLTETAMRMLKSEFTTFMQQHPPSNEMVTVPNLENARLAALIESYSQQMDQLATEEAEWRAMMEDISKRAPEDEDINSLPPPSGQETQEGDAMEASKPNTTQVHCELAEAKEITSLHHQTLAQVEESAKRLVGMEDSIESIGRLLLQAEIKKSELFDAFHGSAFKGYLNMADPKETLRALLKLAPPLRPSS